MRRGNVVVALALLTQIASAPVPGASNLGFDPAKFGLPIYPGATLRAGSATSVKGAFGRTQRLAVLTAADPEDKVAGWYAAHWRGARHRAFPQMHMDQFGTGWGATNVLVTITNADGQTEIRVMVPGS